MITLSQQLDKEGMTFVTSGSRLQEETMKPIRKKGLMSGRTALIILGIFGFVLSVAFPYGMGLVVFAWAIALVGALCVVGIACFSLLKDLLGRTATFGYKPTTAYMPGTKIKRSRKKEAADDEKKNG